MLVKTFGSALLGIEAIIVTVEVSVSRGVNFYLVGLPDNTVRESQQRIATALEANGFKMPGRRIVINLAPADIRKEGSAYDLTLATGILAASGQIPHEEVGNYIIMGELSLDGAIRPVKGALPIAIRARELGYRGFILPRENAFEAAIVKGLDVYGADHLTDLTGFFSNKNRMKPVFVDVRKEFHHKANDWDMDFSDVRGHENVKRAFEIAAAGSHNILLIGSPGSGKTMISRRLPTILPPFTLKESLETTKIHSVAGTRGEGYSLMTKRPFRSPHNTISQVAMAGGGSVPRPGEVSLSHNGVLFLDEFPEFQRQVLEVMRQPMEDRKIDISRSRYSVSYPAGFMLVASMNPCPCGYYNHPARECVCHPGMVQKYLNRISGPLLDRIDLHIEVTPVNFEDLSENTGCENSAGIRQRVSAARHIQEKRFEKQDRIHCNAQMTTRMLGEHCSIDKAGRQLMKNAMSKLGLSARAYDRILKVSRTIADLEGSDRIQSSHLAEAIQYRSLDREQWRG